MYVQTPLNEAIINCSLADLFQRPSRGPFNSLQLSGPDLPIVVEI